MCFDWFVALVPWGCVLLLSQACYYVLSCLPPVISPSTHFRPLASQAVCIFPERRFFQMLWLDGQHTHSVLCDCLSLSLSDAGHSAHHTPVPSKCEGGAATLPVWAPQAGWAHAASCVGPAALSAAKIRQTGSWKSPGLPDRPRHARTWTEGHQARAGAFRKKVKLIISTHIK